MKLSIRKYVLALAVVANPGHAQTDQVITFPGDPWPPYVLGKLGEDAEATGGIGIELVNRIVGRIDGVEAKFPLVPWKRALHEVSQGTMDGIAILLKTPEREQRMHYTDPLFTSRDLIWYAKKNFPQPFSWTQLKDLAPYNVGVIRGHSYGEEVDRHIKGETIKITEVTSAQQLFTMLAGGRIALAFANDAVGYTAAASLRESGHEIAAAVKPLAENVYFIAISKKSPALKLIPEINGAIADLREDGTILEILGLGGIQD